MPPAPKRPWYRLHWLTWLVLAFVIWAIVEREREGALADGGGTLQHWMTISQFGWPKTHLTLTESSSSSRPPTFKHDWSYATLSFNVLFCLLLTSATAHVFQLWLRSSNRLHVSLGSLLGLMGVAAILTGMINGNINDSLDWLGWPTLYLIDWDELQQPLKWPLVLALACTIYSLGWLATFAALRLLSLLSPARA